MKIKKENKASNKKILKYCLIAFIILIVVFILATIISYKPVKNLYQEAMLSKQFLTLAQNDLKDKKFNKAYENLSEAEKHLTNASNNCSKIKFWSYTPYIGTQVKAVDHLLLAGINGVSALKDLALLGKDINEVTDIKNKEISYESITKKEKKNILKKIYESPNEVQAISDKLNLAIEEIHLIPKKGLVKPLRDLLEPINNNLSSVEYLVSNINPILKLLPIAAGYPETATYLFLLENNTELRPTGGFIGTYGILKISAGDIDSFNTENIYSIDDPAANYLFIPPPEPLVSYLNINQWLMRDSNWSPDFPESAKKAEEFYHLEQGPEQNINGVIAVTPYLIQSLLKITGPIIIKGDEYNSDNFLEKLQKEVQFGYRYEGIDVSNRKDIINDMATIIMNQITTLPSSKWLDLWQIIKESAQSKQILLYLKDQNLNQYTNQLNWDGSIKDVTYTGRDYLMIVDANLAALKTDSVMERRYEYNLEFNNDTLLATLTLHYKNNGIGYSNNLTTRYRTYTRIYVPKGSQLISSKGFYSNDRYIGGQPVSALVTQDDALNKTVFEGFISTEPQSEEIVTLQYKLPTEIVNLFKNNQYKLYWQKQAGTDNYGLDVNYIFDRDIKNLEALDMNTKINDNKGYVSGNLNCDKNIEISL